MDVPTDEENLVAGTFFFLLALICCNCEALTASFPFHFRPRGLKPMSILVGEALFKVVGPGRILSLDVPGCNTRKCKTIHKMYDKIV